MIIQSVNGADVTLVDGGENTSCFLLDGATLDGFTITGGRANGTTEREQSGGGILAVDAQVRNCTIVSNWARRVGGGLAGENVHLFNCRFEYNQAHYGGGLSASNLSVEASTFIENQALDDGGGMFFQNGDYGGNLLFVGNSADKNGGGAYFNDGGFLEFSSFSNNTARGNGGAFYIADNSSSMPENPIQLDNAIIWEDDDPICRSGSDITLRHICSNESYTNTRSEDLAGNRRTMGPLIDIGAYEWNERSDADSNGLPDAWEEQYFGNSTNANPSGDSANSINTIKECDIANLDPTDPASILRISAIDPEAGVLYFDSLSIRKYEMSWSTNLTENNWISLEAPDSGLMASTTSPTRTKPHNDSTN